MAVNAEKVEGIVNAVLGSLKQIWQSAIIFTVYDTRIVFISEVFFTFWDEHLKF